MKKQVKRILAVVLSLATVLIVPINVYANSTENGTSTISDSTVMVFDNVTVTTKEEANGDTVVCEYIDGILTQKNIVPSNQIGVVNRQFYDSTGRIMIEADTIYANQYGTLTVEEAMQSRAAVYTYYGAIEYRYVPVDAIQYCTAFVYLSEDAPKNTTYRINNYLGKFADLVSLVISAYIGTRIQVQDFLQSLLLSCGIDIASGSLSEPLTTVVSSIKTSYSWKVYDSIIQESHYFSGEKNYINDSYYYTGNTYYDGYTPRDWGTSKMGNGFTVIYPYTNINVNRWIR